MGCGWIFTEGDFDNPDYKQCYKRDYSQMEVLSQNGNQFRIKYQVLITHLFDELIPYEVTKDFESAVWEDGSISLKCVGNGRYLHGIDNIGEYVNNYHDDPCTEDGICPTCKFHVEMGTLQNVQIEIVGLEFGQPEDGIPPIPDIVASDEVINRSDDPIETTLIVKYEETTSETTTWEHAWGIELSASYSSEVNFIVETTTITMGVTLSYNGKYGTSSTVQDKQTIEKRQTYQCPAHHKCSLNLIANHLDNQKVPYTATVRKIVGSAVTEYEEKGIWMGVKSFNFLSEYCTTDLDTNETNCRDRKQVRID